MVPWSPRGRIATALVHLVAVVALVVTLPACAYDLTRDRRTRIEDAEDELGTFARVRVVDDLYVLIDATNDPKRFMEDAALAERVLHALVRTGRFEKRPSEAVSVWLFPSTGPYQSFCKRRWEKPCPTPFGFYEHRSRQIVIDLGLGVGTLVHELIHPIVETDYPGAPLWLDEGIASVFESPILAGDDLVHGAENARNGRLALALDDPTERGEAQIARLFAMDEPAFRSGNERLHYALARVFLQWLDERDVLWIFYGAMRAGKSPEAALKLATGMGVHEAQGTFEEWVHETTF